MFTAILFSLVLYVASFFLVWLGAGLAISAISQVAKSWKLAPFTLSFFVLGILTSLPEITISTIALLDNDPSIMVGNLLGGTIVLFLGVIPLLGAAGKGIKIPKQLGKKELIVTLFAVVAPAFLTADQRLNRWEAIFLMLLYLGTFLFFSFDQSIFQKLAQGVVKKKKHRWMIGIKALFGVLLLAGASNIIVQKTLYFAGVLEISPFFVSLIVISLGSNIPEISLAIRSLITRKSDIALADYLGSAAANTFLLGVFTLLYGSTIYLPNHVLQRFIFLAVGLILFFIFARSKNTLSRRESIVLLMLYVGFIASEMYMITASAL